MRLVVGRPNLPDFDDFTERARTIWATKRLTNNGPMVRELEAKIANYLGVGYCVCVANATLGLEIVAKALGLTGEIIMPSWTFVATAHAMSWVGLKPVFVDVKGHHMDPELVERAITPETSAILHVHTWGLPGPLEELYRIAAINNLRFVCDAAHAFGCSRDAVSLGDSGDAEVFSFHATKFFSTVEGGAITTNNIHLADKCRQTRDFGFRDHQVTSIGTNAKMSELHAAFGLGMLDRLDEIVNINRDNYLLYDQLLPGLLVAPDHSDQSNCQYVVIEVDKRDEVMDALLDIGIRARRYFHPGVHQVHPYSSEGWELPKTERLAERILCLPTGPEVKHSDIVQICSIVEETCK